MEEHEIITNVLENVEKFYKLHPEIKASHGIRHVLAVHNHSQKAIACHLPPLSAKQSMEIQVASLLHDVDDAKYFPRTESRHNPPLVHAQEIMQQSHVPKESHEIILSMIQWVSCSSNGNSIPLDIIHETHNNYHLLIPRWSDRLEAAGPVGVVRCYQYNQEKNHPLASSASPRAKTLEQVWEFATPARFVEYQKSGGRSSTDMISHYYDKLLHVALPPRDIVRNRYLEYMQQESVVDLVEVCIRFGKSGKVDEEYILGLAKSLGMEDSGD
jgi:uncharacterized protein